MSDAAHDQNLLFGILAFQMSFVDRDQLVDAMHTWVLEKSKHIGTIMVEKEFLSEDRFKLLENLVQEHVRQFDNDARKSLSALSPDEVLRKDLAAIDDDGLQNTLSVVSSHDKESDADATQTFTVGDAPLAGRRFHVLRAHAEGGLGKVSVAMDEELHREVALKELKSFHADNLNSRARFVQEAEINGRLEHPGIVPVYGLGQYADGRPFYAMRFIRGDTMKDAIACFHKTDKGRFDPGERLLEFRQLLRQFVAVCRAIHYAHCRGVVHRDLKPANVMLGNHGETLVVDWGLAKPAGQALRSDSNDESQLVPMSGSKSAPTAMGKTMGTPAYMSPEQAAGEWEQVGPTSDVYSLGATLHQLLTGQPAFSGRNTTEVLNKVREGSFPAPRAVNPAAPKPLEAICLKSMSLSRQDRYESAKDLADDVERWLADEPVTAYKDTSVDRLLRWLRHHRSWAVAATLALVSIAVVSILAAFLVNAEKQRAIAARADAVHRFQQARTAVDVWLTGANEYLLYYPNMAQVRAKLLDQAVEDYETFALGSGGDLEIDIERGRTLLRLGDVRKELLEDQAAQKAYRQAIAVLEGIVASAPDSLEANLVYAKALTRLGVLQWDADNYLEANKTYESAIHELEVLVSKQPEDPRVHEALGVALTNQAICYAERHSHDRAESTFRQAISKLAFTKGKVSESSPASESLAATYHLLGRLLTDLGEYAEASDEIRRSLTAFDELVDRDQKFVSGRADAKNSMTILLRLQGKWSEELRLHHSIIEDYKTLASVFPNSPVVTEKMAIAKLNFGQLLSLLERPSEARQELSEALLLLKESLWEPDSTPTSPHYCFVSAICYDVLGEILSDQGDNSNGETAFAEAIESLSLLADNSTQTQKYRERLAITQSHAVQFLHKLGKQEEAIVLFDSACKTLHELIEISPQRPSLRNQLGIVLSHRGRMYRNISDSSTASENFALAQEVWDELLDRQQAPAAQHLRDYAWFLATCSDSRFREPKRSVELMRRAMADVEYNPTYHSTLGVALFRGGDLQGAQVSFENAKQYRGERIACDWFFLSMILWEQGEQAQARESFEQGLDWMNQRRPENAELKRFQDEAASVLGIE